MPNEYNDNQYYEQERKKDPKRRPYVPSTAFIIILILIGLLMIYCKTMLPKHLYENAQKDYENGKYEQALKIFNIFALIDPMDEEVILYQAKTLSKLPTTYSRQKLLYDISELEEEHEGQIMATKVVKDIREQIENKVGENYIESVLFENQVLRWNLNYQPLTYYIKNNVKAPDYFEQSVRADFIAWTKASNNLVSFKEISDETSANIVVTLTNSVPDTVKQYYDKYQVGATVPIISNDVLKQMNIYIKVNNEFGRYFQENEINNVITHEIGHSLGIWGHSSNPNDIMFYQADNIVGNNVKYITQRDINTLKLLYQLCPDTTNVSYTDAEKEKFIYHFILTQNYDRNSQYEIRRIMAELDANRNDISKWVELAIIYAEEKRYAQSNLILSKALPLIPKDINNMHVIYYNMATNYYNLKQYDNAQIYITKAQRLKNDNDTKMLSAFIKFRKKLYSEAEKELTPLFERDPGNTEIALKLAYIYKASGRNEQVKEILLTLVKNNPKARYDRRVLKYKIGKIYLNLATGAV